MAWASAPWALLQVAPDRWGDLGQVSCPPHALVSSSRHRRRKESGFPCAPFTGLPWYPSRWTVEGTEGTGLHAPSRRSQHPRLEGEAGVQLGGEDSRARAWLRVGAPWRGGKGPTAGATK